jgi:hypothetical protein
MELLDSEGTVCVPAFGGILVADGQQMGTLTLYKRVPSLTAHDGRSIALIIEPAFRRTYFFHNVVSLDA